MYFDTEKLRQLSAEAEKMIQAYKSKYFDLKNNVNIEKAYDVLWADGHAEPYYADYINDLDNMPERKIYKSEPRKKEYCSKHYFDGDLPVYSVFFDGYGKINHEKFFLRNGNTLTGAAYSAASGMLLEISLEIYDDQNKPLEYRLISLWELNEPTLNCRVYSYEGCHIVSAESIERFYIHKEIMPYNHPYYENWINRDLDYMLSVPPMNPYMINSYEFLYEESGAPQRFSRTGYSYCSVSKNEWKMRKKLTDKFAKYGIPWFIK